MFSLLKPRYHNGEGLLQKALRTDKEEILMDYEILQVLPVSREILLVITRRMGKRNQHLSRKTAFRRNTSQLLRSWSRRLW